MILDRNGSRKSTYRARNGRFGAFLSYPDQDGKGSKGSI
jgi:hypothetical protein